MKVLIAEDDVTSMLLLKKILKPGGYVVTGVRNGEEAIALLREQTFDIVLTDWMMPVMDGMELIRRIRATRRLAPVILMITAVASSEARAQAMEAGADGYLAKPIRAEEVLASIIREVEKRSQGMQTSSIIDEAVTRDQPPFVGVGIAASTGGPTAVRRLFRAMGEVKEACFLLVQHGPAWMLESFVARIQDETAMPVRLGASGMPIAPGEIYLAPGDRHMIVDPSNFQLRLIDDPPENFVRPAADPLFRSIARTFGSQSIGLVMTGMGRDGTLGSGYIKAAGGFVMAQDPLTATLPNMPRSVIELRIASTIVPLDNLGSELARAVRTLSRSPARASLMQMS